MLVALKIIYNSHTNYRKFTKENTSKLISEFNIEIEKFFGKIEIMKSSFMSSSINKHQFIRRQS